MREQKFSFSERLLRFADVSGIVKNTGDDGFFSQVTAQFPLSNCLNSFFCHASRKTLSNKNKTDIIWRKAFLNKHLGSRFGGNLHNFKCHRLSRPGINFIEKFVFCFILCKLARIETITKRYFSDQFEKLRSLLEKA